MMEMVGFRYDILWDGWVEISPVTAKQLDIQDGDLIWIESEVGRLRARTKIWPGIMPDIIGMPVGLGHEAYGRYAQNRGKKKFWRAFRMI